MVNLDHPTRRRSRGATGRAFQRPPARVSSPAGLPNRSMSESTVLGANPEVEIANGKTRP